MWYVALRPLNFSVISLHLTTKQQHLFPSKMILQEVLTRKIASLSSRRFWGKGERWKRKRERPSKISSPLAP